MWARGWVGVVALLSACVTPSAERRHEAELPAEPLAAGFAALASADYTEAGRQLAEAARRYPILEDYTLYFGARAAARVGHVGEALDAAQALRDGNPESIWTAPSMLLTGEVMRASGDREGAQRWLATARDALPHGDARWARATVGLAEVEVEASDSPADWIQALALAREVRRSQPRHLAARRARRLTDRIRAAQTLVEAEDHVEEGEIRLRESDATGALAEATSALTAAPPPELTGRALWVRAQAEHTLGLVGAEVTCLTLARRLPTDPLAPRALRAAAGWRWNADDDPGALVLFRDLARRFPVSPEAPEALYAVGRIYQEEGTHTSARYADAAAAYLRLSDLYPGAALAPEARWRAGFVRYLAGDFAVAEQAFATLTARSGGSILHAAEYWRARALERLGQTDPARAALERVAEDQPTSYYAGLAEEWLGRRKPPIELPAAVPRPAFPTQLTGAHAERALLLDRLSFPRFARREVDALRADGASPEALVLAYRALDAPGAALRLVRAIEPDAGGDPNQDFYPLGYWKTLRPAAESHGLDPLLVTALIRQESLFDPEAVSSANARGLMQLLPTTAREISRTSGTPLPEPFALADPVTNVALGVTLLARLRDRYGGSIVKALAAYNAGEDAVGKWERRYGNRDADEFVELISYRETREYVKLVLRNYRVYRQLYGRPRSASAPETSAGRPPNAPFDMMTSTSPGRAVSTR